MLHQARPNFKSSLLVMSSSTDIVNIVARLVVITALFLFGSLSKNEVQAQQIEFADQDQVYVAIGGVLITSSAR